MGYQVSAEKHFPSKFYSSWFITWFMRILLKRWIPRRLLRQRKGGKCSVKYTRGFDIFTMLKYNCGATIISNKATSGHIGCLLNIWSADRERGSCFVYLWILHPHPQHPMKTPWLREILTKEREENTLGILHIYEKINPSSS